MCGICGWVGVTRHPGDAQAEQAMSESLSHRGPDGHGEARLESRVGLLPRAGWLGHRRLKIIDTTESAHQPMAAPDGAVIVSYNGEVYNFRELRRELQALGYRFASTGDTEVVLNAYRAWGRAAVSRLDGMFALAIWDRDRGELLLARDRTGKKPLFYSRDGGRVTFGSEIKSVLRAPWVEATPDLEAIPQVLTWGYVPGPGTAYRSVQQVPPASYLLVGADGSIRTERYWSAVPSEAPRRPGGDFDAELRRRFDDAVRRRMIADVPLGALLSGGIDSALVVSAMSKYADAPVSTFSIGFPEDASYDETGHARALAEHFGTTHTEFSVRTDAAALMDRLLWHHDQPYGDSSAVPTFLVSKLAREHVKVVLNGDGGDEVFGGYDRFRAARLSRMLPPGAGTTGRLLARALPTGDGYFDVRRRLQHFAEVLDQPLFERYESWVSIVGVGSTANLMVPELRAAAATSVLRQSMSDHYAVSGPLGPLDRILHANFVTYLPDDLAVKMDRMSMANSLEARSPFLDTAVIEHLARISAGRKIGLRQVKPRLRRAFAGRLPDDVWRRPKHGFGVPMGAWFRGVLGDAFSDEVLGPDARTSEVFERSAIEGMMRAHRAREADHGHALWTILTVERWLRLDPTGPAPPLALS